jgi:hypothetical protein
MTAVPPFANP